MRRRLSNLTTDNFFVAGCRTPRCLTTASFEDCPIEEIPVSEIVPSQRYLDRDIVDKYMTEESEPPEVVFYRGRYHLKNGHHRVVAAIKTGATTIRAKVCTINRS